MKTSIESCVYYNAFKIYFYNTLSAKCNTIYLCFTEFLVRKCEKLCSLMFRIHVLIQLYDFVKDCRSEPQFWHELGGSYQLTKGNDVTKLQSPAAFLVDDEEEALYTYEGACVRYHYSPPCSVNLPCCSTCISICLGISVWPLIRIENHRSYTNRVQQFLYSR